MPMKEDYKEEAEDFLTNENLDTFQLAIDDNNGVIDEEVLNLLLSDFHKYQLSETRYHPDTLEPVERPSEIDYCIDEFINGGLIVFKERLKVWNNALTLEQVFDMYKKAISFLRMAETFNTIHIIENLVKATDILLLEKDYDGHGWEVLEKSSSEGKKLLASLKNKSILKEIRYDSNTLEPIKKPVESDFNNQHELGQSYEYLNELKKWKNALTLDQVLGWCNKMKKGIDEFVFQYTGCTNKITGKQLEFLSGLTK